jgi:hypothetical protein
VGPVKSFVVGFSGGGSSKFVIALITAAAILSGGARMKSQKNVSLANPRKQISMQCETASTLFNFMERSGNMVASGPEEQLCDALAGRIDSGTSEIQKVMRAAFLGS